MVRQEWKEIAHLRLKSDRLQGESAWRFALEELHVFRRSVVEATAAFWLAAHPSSRIPLRRFEERTQVRPLQIEGNETLVSLDVLAGGAGQAEKFEPGSDEISRTVHRIWMVLTQAAENRLQPGAIETPLASVLAWGLLLTDEETVELTPTGEVPVLLSASHFRLAYSHLLASHGSGPATTAGVAAALGGPGEAPRRKASIEEVLESIAAEIPDEEWEKLPADLSYNLDHYLYGAPKK